MLALAPNIVGLESHIDRELAMSILDSLPNDDEMSDREYLPLCLLKDIMSEYLASNDRGINRFFFAMEDGEVVGAIGIMMMSDCVYIANLMVLPDHQHKGIGETLLQEAVRLAEASSLPLVCMPFRSAEGFYKKQGFVESIADNKWVYNKTSTLCGAYCTPEFERGGGERPCLSTTP